MLSDLKIENVAVIEKADVHFASGLNVLTGETGAGKSILIDSINAILGNRASKELVRTGAQKACIWATFERVPPHVQELLSQAGYEAGEDLLLYREISREGKSSCRINGMPATASAVREICAGLVNIHGQHDSQNLTNPARHLQILDSFARNEASKAAYYEAYRQLIAVKRQADALQMDESERQRRLDLLRYEINEIEAADLKAGEEEALAARKKVAAHAQNIARCLMSARQALAGADDEPGATDLLGGAMNQIQEAARLDDRLEPALEKISDLYYSAQELASWLSDADEEYHYNPEELDQIEERLDVLYRLRQKYGDDIPAILARLEKDRRELDTMESSAEELEKLEAEKRRLYQKARELANALTQTRLQAFEVLNKRLSEELRFLNMPGIRFALQHTRGPLASSGQDTIEFYISANPGEEPKPLAKIASGGELSRIMLALKSALAERDDIPTIIYDEIDTGVSGSAAGKIGLKLKETARDRQVLCITHTAQIAALADHHLLIRKNVTDQKTYTEIHPLDEEGRIQALARIISGDNVTELSLANAREMLHQGGT